MISPTGYLIPLECQLYQPTSFYDHKNHFVDFFEKIQAFPLTGNFLTKLSDNFDPPIYILKILIQFQNHCCRNLLKF